MTRDAMQGHWAADNLDPERFVKARGHAHMPQRRNGLLGLLSRPSGADFNELSDRAEIALQSYVANQDSLGADASLLAHCLREAVDDAISGRKHGERNVYAHSWDDIRAIDAKKLYASADAKAKNYKAYFSVQPYIHGASFAVGDAIAAYVAERTQAPAQGAARG